MIISCTMITLNMYHPHNNQSPIHHANIILLVFPFQSNIVLSLFHFLPWNTQVDSLVCRILTPVSTLSTFLVSKFMWRFKQRPLRQKIWAGATQTEKCPQGENWFGFQASPFKGRKTMRKKLSTKNSHLQKSADEKASWFPLVIWWSCSKN